MMIAHSLGKETDVLIVCGSTGLHEAVELLCREMLQQQSLQTVLCGLFCRQEYIDRSTSTAFSNLILL